MHPLGGVDLRRWHFFSENVCKNERIGSHGGGVRRARPPDPPMKTIHYVALCVFFPYTCSSVCMKINKKNYKTRHYVAQYIFFHIHAATFFISTADRFQLCYTNRCGVVVIGIVVVVGGVVNFLNFDLTIGCLPLI